MHIDDLDTPAVIVDLDIVKNNIRRMQTHLDAHSIKCRPHVKTHKIPAIAHMQVNAGAVGITSQKLGEAEVMINSGIKDVCIPYNIVGKQKLDRLMRLSQQANVSVTVDNLQVAEGICKTAQVEGIDIPVLVDCDIGGNRTGIQNPEKTASFVQKVEKLKNLDFKGFLTFKGGFPIPEHFTHVDQFFKKVVQILKGFDLKAEIISADGTVYAWTEEYPFGVNETRPGVYVYNDLVKVAQGATTPDKCAMRIVSTVVSRPTNSRAIIDAGSKTFSLYRSELIDGFGHILEYPNAKIYSCSEEHGHIDVTKSDKPQIGERLNIVPNYVNSVTNLTDFVYGVQGDKVITIWPILARGKVQ